MYTVSYQDFESTAAARWPGLQRDFDFIFNSVQLTRWDAEHKRLATHSPYESLGVRRNFRCFQKQMRKSTNHARTSAKEAFTMRLSYITSNITTGYNSTTFHSSKQLITPSLIACQAAQRKAVR